MNTSIAAFLRRKGAVELLCIADQRTSRGRFTDLDDEINVSHSTLAKRLDEARKLGLMTVVLNPEEESPVNVYRTTEAGERLRDEMRQLGLPRTYEKLRSVEELFAEGCEELAAWAEELDGEMAEKTENAESDSEPVDEEMLMDVLVDIESVDER